MSQHSFYLADLQPLRQHLAQWGQLHEPRFEPDGVLRWIEAAVEDAFQWTDGVPLTSLKPFFFAERETVFVFDGQHFRSQLPSAPKRVFLGVKACDAAALAVQDRFFAEDSYYKSRRQAALVVAVDCRHPCAKGFCPLTQSGPCVREGADIVLTPAPLGWYLQVATEQGQTALAGLSLAASDDMTVNQHRQKTEQQCLAEFSDLSTLATGMARLQAGQVTATEWETLAVQCLSCSGCVNLCPTCSCFTTFDVTHADKTIVRERVWDSCLYDGFQREASDHNPTATAGARTARYWFHKFSPAFIPTQGRLGCTGCGRCDGVCPTVIGARSVLTRLAHA